MQTGTSSPRKINWRVPVVILLFTAALVCFIHFSERVESYVAAYAISAIAVLAIVGLFIWFVRFSGLPRQTRKLGAWAFIALVALGALAVKLTTRTEGVINGVGFPRLVWRWSPRISDEVPPIQLAHGAVNLTTTFPSDFPEFLGRGRTNAVQGAGLATNWSKSPRILWKQPIGAGWSSFAVVGPWAVTQEQRGTRELVVCYDIATGIAEWAHAHENTRFSDSQGGDGPRATPTIAAGRVYAMGATGILDCLDGADGHPIWSVPVIDRPDQNLTYGKSCSPLMVDDLVIVTGGREGPSLRAYHVADGSHAWDAGSESPGYASPILATLAGVRQVITVNANSITAHDPSDGRILWRFDWPGGMPKNIQPIPIGTDRLLISAGYGVGTTLLHVTSNNGMLRARPLWTSPRLKPKLTNNVVHNGYAYGIDDPGALTCIDIATGKRKWRDGDYGFGQLLLVDDLLLVQCESGEIALIDPRPDGLHEIARVPVLDSHTWVGPALSGHRLLVRSDKQAACVELP